MNISIVKLTPSKKQKNLMFADVRIDCLKIALKGVKILLKDKSDTIILLPSLSLENEPKNGKKRIPYSPFTFLSKDDHKDFIESVKLQVSKLLNIGNGKSGKD